MKALEFHPAAEIFPLLEGDELKSLAKSIEEHGQQLPILLFKGKVIDGRNRYAACKIAKAEPWTATADLNGMEPEDFVLAMNEHRRHMTTSQRAMAAARLKEMLEARAEKHQISREKVGENLPANLRETEATVAAAEQMKVSPRTIHHAETVIEQGSAQLVKAVETGDMPVSAAAKIAELPKKQQPAAIKEHKEKKKKNGAETSDPRGFAKLESAIGACVRAADTLNEKAPGPKFRDAMLSGFNTSLKALKEWRRAVR